jgi:cell division protein FtsB
MTQGFEPPSSMRPPTSHLEGRNAMGWAVVVLTVLALVFVGLSVAGAAGALEFRLVDLGLAALLGAAALVAERERRRLRR